MAMLCDSFSANGSNYYSEQPNGNTANLHQQYLYGQLHHRKSYNSFCERAESLGVFLVVALNTSTALRFKS